jgi:hypothetical protein
MLRLKCLGSIAKLRAVPRLSVFCWLALLLGGASTARGQNFTLSASPFNPYAIDQGGTTLSTITLDPVNGFSGTVTLGCTVAGTGVNVPVCLPSPASVTPPATASLTFTGLDSSGASATPGSYVVTVTGTSGSLTNSQTLNISVLAVAPSFTVTVQRGMEPASINAGATASAILNINPVNSYTGTVSLSCLTISPLVIYPPICTFNPAVAPVTNGIATVTMTIQTSGNAQKTSVSPPRNKFFALWLPLPMLALVGIGAAGSRRSRKAWALLGLFILAGAIMLLPACGNTTTGSTAPTTVYITPKDAYTFTLVGVDSNGVISTNSGVGAPTVTLTVN